MKSLYFKPSIYLIGIILTILLLNACDKMDRVPQVDKKKTNKNSSAQTN